MISEGELRRQFLAAEVAEKAGLVMNLQPRLWSDVTVAVEKLLEFRDRRIEELEEKVRELERRRS